MLVSRRRIAAIGAQDKIVVPAGARTIDGRGKFLVPGFIDSNVHVTYYGDDIAVHARY